MCSTFNWSLSRTRLRSYLRKTKSAPKANTTYTAYAHAVLYHGGRTMIVSVAPFRFQAPSLLQPRTLKMYVPGSRLVYVVVRRGLAGLHSFSNPSRTCL